MKTTFGIIALMAVVLVAGCASNAPATGNGGATGAKTVNVAITDSGFEQEVLAINSGDTVVWTSSKDGGTWPASDDHPAHTKLPGFDALKGLSRGQTYQFAFTKAGTWGYHDHLHPTVVGTIIVK